MIRYREVVAALRDLELGPRSHVIAHLAPDAFGPIAGGVDTLVGALVGTLGSVLSPTFTTRAMIVPEVGPEDNALEYGRAEENKYAEIFRAGMPADPGMGAFAESLRQHPQARRSDHPLLSFAGVNAEAFFTRQSLEEPWGPIDALARLGGYVLMAGTSHRANCSIHYAEAQAGRRTFIRWALTAGGVVECPQWPGCSDGFAALESRLTGVVRSVELGRTVMEVIPVRDLVHVVVSWIRQDPRALLCDRLGCPRCSAVRAAVRVER